MSALILERPPRPGDKEITLHTGDIRVWVDRDDVDIDEAERVANRRRDVWNAHDSLVAALRKLVIAYELTAAPEGSAMQDARAILALVQCDPPGPAAVAKSLTGEGGC